LHVVGSSTGGAIAQSIALDHADVVRSLTISSSFARADEFLRREFTLRRWLVAEADPHMIYTAYALFLFSPRYTLAHADRVASWIERCAKAPRDREIALQRIDMIIAHDVSARLGEIRQPTLIIGGDHDFCTPPQLSDELMRGIPHAERVILPGGHLIHEEAEEPYFEAVRAFVAQH
jgi:aminoacrylate hydrolase